MLKNCYILVILTALSLSAFAQTHTLSGWVTESGNRQPITGATIVLAGTQNYDVSGLDGSFNIRSVPAGDYTVEISFVSFEKLTQRITLNGDLRMEFRLAMQAMELEGVEVSGSKVLDTEASARASERMSMTVLNVISSREIEVSPDITVANVVQRVSGVSLERNANGDGQHAIVRGMDKRYNYTLVNGIKIPSPDVKNRYVPLDIFPSDLLDRLEVTKALTPNMEGDAIGGVIDMKMKNAPDKFTLNVNMGTGYNQLFIDRDFRTFDHRAASRKSPHQANGRDYLATSEDFTYGNIDFHDIQAPPNQIYGLAIGNRTKNGRLGALVAGSYQNTYRGANSMFMSTFIDQESNTPYYEILQLREFSVQQKRSGVHAKLDYKINPNHVIDLYACYINLSEFEVRNRIDTILKIGRGQGPGTGRVELRDRSRQRHQKIYNTTLQGRHRLGERFRADWSGVFSLATSNDPDMAQLTWLTGVTRNAEGEYSTEPILYDRDYDRRWTSNTDQDLAFYGNLNYFTKLGGHPLVLSTGGMFRHKNRDNEFDSYLLRTAPITQEWSGSVNDYTWNLFNSIGSPTDPLNYSSMENVMATYGMFKLDMPNVQVLGGVRYEGTVFSWESNAPANVAGRTGSIAYADLLPSLHIKYTPDEIQAIRLSYFSSISRPSFFEVIPYEINEDDFRERGNPFLQHTQANNIDLRYERFSYFLDKFMIGGFFKRIDNPIESALLIQGQTIFQQPNNFGTAYNYGIEVDFIKYLRNFGVRFFYTYTNSAITTSKIVRFRDDQGNLTSREEMQTRPLQGQSRHISNASLLYKNVRKGLDAQLAMVYTGSRIIIVSPYLDNDVWQRAFVQLDFSIEKRIKERFVVYGKINNLLDTPMQADILLPNKFNPEQAPYLDSSESVMVREDFYRQMYIIGVRYQIR